MLTSRAQGEAEWPITTRCSGRIRASRPLPGSHGVVGLRTVTRKGRATRPAAERERYACSQNSVEDLGSW